MIIVKFIKIKKKYANNSGHAHDEDGEHNELHKNIDEKGGEGTGKEKKKTWRHIDEKKERKRLEKKKRKQQNRRKRMKRRNNIRESNTS